MAGFPAPNTSKPPFEDPNPPLWQVGINPPPVPGDTKNGGGQKITVNIEALRKLADNLEALTPAIDISVNQLNAVLVRAGSFPNAVNLANSVNAPGRLTDTLLQVFTLGKKSIHDIAAALRKIAADCEKAEELNSLTVSEYGRYISTALGDVNTITGLGDPANPAAKGGGSDK